MKPISDFLKSVWKVIPSQLFTPSQGRCSTSCASCRPPLNMAASTPMSDFNKSSARIAHLIAKICHGTKKSYTYVEKKSQKEITAYKFECLLLGDKEGVYMCGFLKGTQQQVNDAANKFKDGQVFKLSKISLDTWTSTTSISSPKAFRLNLEKTTCQQIAANDALAQQIPLAPVPPRTVGETAKVTTNKNQDLLAVVKAATNKRTTRDGIDIIDAVLIDDSKAETGQFATVLVSVWGDEKVNLIEENVGKPLAFFNLTIKMEAGNRVVNHYAEALLLAAPDSEKTEHLLAEASTLTGATNTVQLSKEREWHPQESPDVSGPQPLCCAAFLDLTAEEPAAANMPSVVQIPWLLLEEPAQDEDVEVTNQHGGRLWFVTKARDCSGAVRVGCPQRIALTLANATDKGDFKAKHGENSLGFPLFVHARLTRSVRQGSGENAGKEFVSNTLQEVANVSWAKSEAPNASFHSLLTILNNLPADEECIQFCYLKDLKPDPHYGFSIEYDGLPGPRAAYAVVMVESLNATTTQASGDGFKAETQGIRDVAFIGDASQLADVSSTGDAASQEVFYRAVGFSNLNGIVKLDPPRGKKSRFAVLLVDKIDDMTIEMQKAEFVEPEDAAGAVKCFRRLRQVCKQIKQITPSGSAKRPRSESISFVATPKDLKKCRTLKVMPTDSSMDA